MWSALSTQHSALSTQHSALSITLANWCRILVKGFCAIVFSGISIANAAGTQIEYGYLATVHNGYKLPFPNDFSYSYTNICDAAGTCYAGIATQQVYSDRVTTCNAVLNYRTSDGLSHFANYIDYVNETTPNDFSLISVGAPFTDHLGYSYDENQCILYNFSALQRRYYGEFTTSNQNGMAAGFGYPSIRTMPVAKCVGHARWGGYWFAKEAIELVCPPTLLGFFNGVDNTEKQAEDSLGVLIDAFPPNNPEKPIKHDLFYNQTACTNGTNLSCLVTDAAEVFAQRDKELGGILIDRWELFWEILAGRHNQADSFAATLLSKLIDTSGAFLNLLESIFGGIMNGLAGTVSKIITMLANSPDTQADVTAHLKKLKDYADKGSGMVLVAHSQGNLFVNAAHDGIMAHKPTQKIEVVHVAPAAPTMRTAINGVVDYALAGIDLVINALRIITPGQVPNANLSIPAGADATGHKFVETYMDKTRTAYDSIKSMIQAGLDRVSP